MKKFIIAILLSWTTASFAEDKSDEDKKVAPVREQKQSHMQMHEHMAMAHQEAAACLKAGKPEEECRMAFHEKCKESGRPEMCGPRKMHDKKGKKSKK